MIFTRNIRRVLLESVWLLADERREEDDSRFYRRYRYSVSAICHVTRRVSNRLHQVQASSEAVVSYTRVI